MANYHNLWRYYTLLLLVFEKSSSSGAIDLEPDSSCFGLPYDVDEMHRIHLTIE